MKQINKNKPLEKESDFRGCHIMFSFQQQKNETNKGDKKQCSVLEEVQPLDLLNKDFKSAILSKIC